MRSHKTFSVNAQAKVDPQPDEWTKVSLSRLERCVERASVNGQHLFIWDQTGQASCFFELFGIHNEFTERMVEVAMAKSECLEEALTSSLHDLRRSLTEAHSTERPLLINLGLLAPDFNRVYTDPEIWPADKIYDWDEFQS